MSEIILKFLIKIFYTVKKLEKLVPMVGEGDPIIFYYKEGWLNIVVNIWEKIWNEVVWHLFSQKIDLWIHIS